MSILAHICQGIKNGHYHVTYGSTWPMAVQRWHETDPRNTIDLGIPF